MKVDPYLNEPTADLDPETHAAYLEARSNAKAWMVEAERLKEKLQLQLGDKHAGLVLGRKVITHRPVDTYRIKDLVRDYPDLTQHYFITKETEVFDLDTFQHAHADLLAPYQSRQFKSVADLDT